MAASRGAGYRESAQGRMSERASNHTPASLPGRWTSLMSEEPLPANFLDPSPLAGPVNEFFRRLTSRLTPARLLHLPSELAGVKRSPLSRTFARKTSSPARQPCWGRLPHSAERLLASMISYEFLCSFYAVSMAFLCGFYIVSEPVLLKKRLFSRGISSPVCNEKKIRVQRTRVRPAGSDRLAVQSQRDIPGSILDRFWIDSGSILDRFWIGSGRIRGSPWIGSGSETPRKPPNS